jgi:hypothetical protein
MRSDNTLSSLVDLTNTAKSARMGLQQAVEAHPNVGSEPYSGRAEARL